MKTILFFLCLVTGFVSEGQILCIDCYDQNIRVLSDTSNLILNGGFETTTCIPDVSHQHSYCPNSNNYDCDFANWTCTGGGVFTYASLMDSAIAATYNVTIIVEGQNAVYFGNDFCNICSAIIEDTTCLTSSGCEVTGIPAGYPENSALYGGTAGISLQQTVSGLTIGHVYALEFWSGGESQNVFDNNGLFAVDLGFGNVFLRDPPTPAGTGIGKRYVIVFIADSTSHTIKFTNWGHIGGSNPYYSTELILDDVRLVELEDSPCKVGIEEQNNNSVIEVYPNPVTNKLNISRKNHEPSVVILYDLLSGKIFEQTFTDFTSIDVEKLANCIYIYEVSDIHGVFAKGKIVKE